LAAYTASSFVKSISCFPGGIVLGEESGKISVLMLDKELACSDFGKTTIRSIWDFEMHKYLPLLAYCPLCGYRFEPSDSVLATIGEISKKTKLKPEQSPCLELPDDAWENSGLLSNCPKCLAALKFNPFIAKGGYKPKPDWKFWKS